MTLRHAARAAVNGVLARLGYEVRRLPDPVPEHYPPPDRSIIRDVLPDIMQSPERIFALLEATRYVVRSRIPGAFVECGVFRGGSVVAAGRVLLAEGAADRDVYLYDTFEGMPPPGEHDRSASGAAARERFEALKRTATTSDWCRATLDEVRTHVERSGYPPGRLHFVKGMVEETVPSRAPERIALLRLDTDWYESTRHELEHLYPRLSRGGILIVDDYGRWQGSRKATDEYLAAHRIAMYLHPIDSAARIGVKP